jgi:hypothetical protein
MKKMRSTEPMMARIRELTYSTRIRELIHTRRIQRLLQIKMKISKSRMWTKKRRSKRVISHNPNPNC